MIVLYLSDALHCEDPSLGRFDKSCLPQQTLMELFLSSIDTTDDILSIYDPDRVHNVRRWYGLWFNSNKEVTDIVWQWKNLEGSLNLKWIPSTVEKVELNKNKLHGTLDLSALPDGLVKFSAPRNNFTGEIAIHQLPSKMKYLNLTHNSLSGTLNFTNLPVEMHELYLHDNSFTGQADFSELPKSLEWLDISKNDLTGTLTIPHGYGFYAEDSNVRIINMEE